MDFWLFEIDQLTWLGCVKRDQNRQGLRNPKTDIGNVYHVTRAILTCGSSPSHLKFNLSIIDAFRCNFPSEAKLFEVCIQLSDLVFFLFHLPSRNDTCRIVFKSARKGHTY